MSVAAVAQGAADIEIGSAEYLALFCRALLDTHNSNKPEILDWPLLDDGACRQLVELPIWDMAVQSEGHASVRVLSYGDQVDDPLLRHAIEMNGFKEARHKRVLSNLAAAYAIPLAVEPNYPKPRNGEWAFLITD